jgi:ElaB/YqjD/DUF883 family membrane-anchored ribosome-binding protein
MDPRHPLVGGVARGIGDKLTSKKLRNVLNELTQHTEDVQDAVADMATDMLNNLRSAMKQRAVVLHDSRTI